MGAVCKNMLGENHPFLSFISKSHLCILGSLYSKSSMWEYWQILLCTEYCKNSNCLKVRALEHGHCMCIGWVNVVFHFCTFQVHSKRFCRATPLMFSICEHLMDINIQWNMFIRDTEVAPPNTISELHCIKPMLHTTPMTKNNIWIKQHCAPSDSYKYFLK